MNEQGNPSRVSPTSVAAPTGPLTVGQILDRIYQLMRAHLRLFLGVAAVPAATIFFFVTMMSWFMFGIMKTQLAGKTTAPPHLPPWTSIVIAGGELLLVMVLAIYLAAALYAAMQSDRGVAVTFRQAYQMALRRFGRYLWLMILCALYVVVPALIAAALIGCGALIWKHAAGGSAGSPQIFLLIPLLVLLYLCFLVYSVLVMLRFALAYPASVEEDLPARVSLRRSAQLTRGAKGHIFLVMLVIYAATYAVQLVGFALLVMLGALGFMGAMLPHVTWGSPASFILAGLGGLGYFLVIIITTLICYATLTTALAVLYRGQRLREDAAMAQAG